MEGSNKLVFASLGIESLLFKFFLFVSRSFFDGWKKARDFFHLHFPVYCHSGRKKLKTHILDIYIAYTYSAF